MALQYVQEETPVQRQILASELSIQLDALEVEGVAGAVAVHGQGYPVGDELQRQPERQVTRGPKYDHLTDYVRSLLADLSGVSGNYLPRGTSRSPRRTLLMPPT